MATWAIESESTTEARHRKALGDTEYERRKSIAAEKRDAFPESEWQAKAVIGGQFESIAMQIDQDMFDKIADKDFRFWQQLVHMILVT